jgi:hypothetical protein
MAQPSSASSTPPSSSEVAAAKTKIIQFFLIRTFSLLQILYALTLA